MATGLSTSQNIHAGGSYRRRPASGQVRHLICHPDHTPRLFQQPKLAGTFHCHSLGVLWPREKMVPKE